MRKKGKKKLYIIVYSALSTDAPVLLLLQAFL